MWAWAGIVLKPMLLPRTLYSSQLSGITVPAWRGRLPVCSMEASQKWHSQGNTGFFSKEDSGKAQI